MSGSGLRPFSKSGEMEITFPPIDYCARPFRDPGEIISFPNGHNLLRKPSYVRPTIDRLVVASREKSISAGPPENRLISDGYRSPRKPSCVRSTFNWRVVAYREKSIFVGSPGNHFYFEWISPVAKSSFPIRFNTWVSKTCFPKRAGISASAKYAVKCPA